MWQTSNAIVAAQTDYWKEGNVVLIDFTKKISTMLTPMKRGHSL